MKPLDLQVNGYAGVDFNADILDPDDLHRACEALRADGVDGILATVITAPIDAMVRRLGNIVARREADPLAAGMITGIHIEGPFINETPGYVGAHPADAVVPASPDVMDRLLDAAGGLARLVTLAPERDPDNATTRFLDDRGVTVAAGHCDPSLRELEAAIDAGLSMFTHLGNGCPMMLHRHDNIIQRVLSMAERLWISFIPDGVHVPFPALGNYVRLAGLERTIFVTDAISAARLGPGLYTLGDQTIRIGEDLVARAPDASHFIGSTVTMPRAIDNLRRHLGFGDAELERTLSANPRRAIGL